MLVDYLPESSRLRVGTICCGVAFVMLSVWHFLKESCSFSILLILADWIGYFGFCLLVVFGTTHAFSEIYSDIAGWAQNLYELLVWGIFWILSDKVFAYLLRINNCSVPGLLFIFDNPGKNASSSLNLTSN